MDFEKLLKELKNNFSKICVNKIRNKIINIVIFCVGNIDAIKLIGHIKTKTNKAACSNFFGLSASLT